MQFAIFRRTIFRTFLRGGLIILLMSVGMAYLEPGSSSIQENVDRYYKEQITAVNRELNNLKKSNHQGAPVKELRHNFISARLAYKKLAVLSEYFNVYDSKFLNGPALNRAEDGTPDIIIPPQGFQALEEKIFSTDPFATRTESIRLIDDMLKFLKRLEDERDRLNKFSPAAVWDALRAAIVRIVALGITGYDSPVALHSLPEARASLQAINDILVLFNTEIDRTVPGGLEQTLKYIEKAKLYLERHPGFDSFNRLVFISDYINPLYTQLAITRMSAGIGTPQGQNAVNFTAQSIFQDNFFNINFFSPGKEYWVSEKRIALGKQLFADPVLSGTKKRSCRSCHTPEKAFSDGLRVPLSVDEKTMLRRNTPTLWNSALQSRQFFDTRTDILEGQLKEVVHNTDEMRGSLAESVAEIKKSPAYIHSFKECYENEPEPISAFNIANAISSYVRSLTTFDSRFDQYMQGNTAKLSASEKRGFNLFAGKAKCATCHFIPLFNGLVPPDFTETETEVLGVPRNKSRTSAVLDPDPGKYEISRSIIHKNAFKTPTLRNIELTAPYMHNGVFDTLEEVMEFYNEGGGAGLNIAPENQTLPKDKLNLTKKETADIIAFMKALTGNSAASYAKAEAE